MRLGPVLPRSFYARACPEVARDLVGTTLVRRIGPGDGTLRVGRVVEVEAYLGDGSDPASHSHRGPTDRNRSMFGPPGRLYAYRSYGIHTCINVVCEPEGRGAAVLLRAIEPLDGLQAMRRDRGLRPGQRDHLIASGPGRLAQAFGIGLDADGTTLLRGMIRLHRATSPVADVVSGARIGISRATEYPLRFGDPSSRWLSRPLRDQSIIHTLL